MSFCSHCGSALNEDAKFCGGCGAKISVVEVAQASANETSSTSAAAELRKKLEEANEDLKSALARVDIQAAKAKEQGEKLGEQTKLALAQGNEELSSEALARRRIIESQLAELEKQRRSIQEQLQKIEDATKRFEIEQSLGFAATLEGASDRTGRLHMFERHKEKRAAEEADVSREEWTDQMKQLLGLLAAASGQTAWSGKSLILKSGEIGVAEVANVGFIEEQRGAGQWQGMNQGVSFPIGKVAGRTVRYRVGGTRGHFKQGTPVPTAVDTGTMTITNQRIVYQGDQRTAECSFSKLLGIKHSGDGISISVSNRQKPTNLFYGHEIDDWVTSHLTLALALFNGEGDAAKAQIEAQINELQASKPT